MSEKETLTKEIKKAKKTAYIIFEENIYPKFNGLDSDIFMIALLMEFSLLTATILRKYNKKERLFKFKELQKQKQKIVFKSLEELDFRRD